MVKQVVTLIMVAMAFSVLCGVTHAGINDGMVPDDEDRCPESNLSETIVIDGCDSGVENTFFGDGCTMSDLIEELADNAENHGQFVSSVSHLTNGWKKEKLIRGKEKGAIMKCAAKAKIPACSVVTVSGKILYNGLPKPSVRIRLIENENGSEIDTAQTDSDGKFSFTFGKIEGVQEYGVDVQPDGMENALTGWRGFRLFDENCENILPDFDMYYVEDISEIYPADGTLFSADAIDDLNPIVFQWPGRSDATSYSVGIHSIDWIWDRYFFPDTSISFNGILNDGTKIVPGTYIWWYWLNFGPGLGDEYWQFWGSHTTGKTLIID
jgi:hypothetical protein